MNMNGKKPFTVGIDARMWGAKQTGIGRYISCLSQRMFELSPDSRFLLFMRDVSHGADLGKYPNVRIARAPERWYSVGEQITFPMRLLAKRMDIFFAPHFNVPLLWRGRFVATIHDVTPLFFPGPLQNASSARTAAFKKVFTSTVHRAAHIIAVSQYTKTEIVKHFGGDGNNISVVYEGLPSFGTSKISDSVLETHRARFGLAKPYVFFVGVWRPHKNLVGLLGAFAALKAQIGPRYLLVLGGEEDPRYPEIRKTWQELGLEKDVICPGFIPEAELPIWYGASSLVVIPSFLEGFGLVGLEALSCGASVAASCGGATPEILKDAAAYFDPADPADMARVMRAVLETEGMRAFQQEKARNVLKLYSWSAAAKETLALLKSAALR